MEPKATNLWNRGMGAGRGAFAPPGFWKLMYVNHFDPPWLDQGGQKNFCDKNRKNRLFWLKFGKKWVKTALKMKIW